MIRVCVLLLVLNLGYLLYAVLQPPAETESVSVGDYVGAESLHLLHESDENERRNQELGMAVNNPLRSDGDDNNCLAFGPFGDLFSGQALVDQLAAMDVPAELRAVDKATGENDYRVVLPPQNSLQDAFRKLRELKSRGIDSYVITEGKESLGISLGVFSTQAAAEGARELRAREGYDALIVEIPRQERAFWVFDAEKRNLDIPPALWDTLTTQNPALQRQFVSCART